ncbi:hypothetical protein YB2330_004626 [Saitoella coloradoensis]
MSTTQQFMPPPPPQDDKYGVQDYPMPMQTGQDPLRQHTSDSSTHQPLPRGADYEAQYLDIKPTPSPHLSRIGNPTPLGLAAHCATLGAASWAIMGFAGTSGAALQALAPEFIFFPGTMLLISAQWELVIGNSFAYTVFGSFSAFWLAFGYLNLPWTGLAASYASDPMGLNHLIGFFVMSFAVLNFFFWVASLKTNVPFVFLFTFLELALILIAAGYLQMGHITDAAVGTILKAGGACGFICTFGGWYLFVVELLGMNGFNIPFPIGDLSHLFGGKKDSKKEQ